VSTLGIASSSCWYAGPLMIVLMVLLFRLALSRRLVDEAREHAELGVLGRMEGHAEMDVSVHTDSSVWHRLQPRGARAPALSRAHPVSPGVISLHS
jgi:hypothetical protein